MSGKDAEEKFLSRWSRRKIEAREGGAAPDGAPDGEPSGGQIPASPPAAFAPAMPPSGAGAGAGPGEGGAPSSTSAPLPIIEELRGLESEYRGFLRPEVDESLRRTALKKLFRDPHFNIMDGLDTYIDDYTKADPIPQAMLRALNQAQGLLFDREGEHTAGEEQRAAVDAAEAPPPVIEAVTEEVTEEVTDEVTEEPTKPTFSQAKEDGNRSQGGPDTPSTST